MLQNNNSMMLPVKLGEITAIWYEQFPNWYHFKLDEDGLKWQKNKPTDPG